MCQTLCVIKNHDCISLQTKMSSLHSIPVTSPSQADDGIYMSAVGNDYIETDQCYVAVAGPTIKVCMHVCHCQIHF